MEIVAVLHNIRSLHNVGSVFRTAEAAGISKIYLSGITPAPLDRFGKFRPQFTKTSLGAEKAVVWEKISQIDFLIKKFRKKRYKIFAVEQSSQSVPYHTIRLREKSSVVLIVGHELEGLPQSILDQSDTILEIPMHDKEESLDVSVAFGIVVFHLIHGSK